MEYVLIGAAVLALGFVAYKIAKASQSKGGRGAGGKSGRSNKE